MNHRSPTSRWRSLCTWASAVALLAPLCVSAWGCAPVASLPAPVPLPAGISNEFGLGVSYSRRSDGTPVLIRGAEPIDGHLWYLRRVVPRLDIALRLNAGYTSMVGGGLTTRFRVVNEDWLTLGFQVDAGYIYGGAGIPVAVRLRDGLWLYSNPSVALRVIGGLQLPIGITLDVDPEMRLGLEAGVHIDLWRGSASPAVAPVQYGMLSSAFSF